MLAVEVFGLECLAASSVYGGRVWNSSSQHAALDEEKLRFAKGDFSIFVVVDTLLSSFFQFF